MLVTINRATRTIQVNSIKTAIKLLKRWWYTKSKQYGTSKYYAKILRRAFQLRFISPEVNNTEKNIHRYGMNKILVRMLENLTYLCWRLSLNILCPSKSIRLWLGAAIPMSYHIISHHIVLCGCKHISTDLTYLSILGLKIKGCNRESHCPNQWWANLLTHICVARYGPVLIRFLFPYEILP